MGKNRSVKQAEAVQRFLQQNAGKEFCHNCLARAVGIKSVHRYIIQLINNPFLCGGGDVARRASPIGRSFSLDTGENLHRTNKRDTDPRRRGCGPERGAHSGSRFVSGRTRA